MMASHSKMGYKRTPQKTYSAFNTLPTLRGKDARTEKPNPEKKFKRPPQFADQILFPGRRLDNRQQSLRSGYSGRSLDLETIISGGRSDIPSAVGTPSNHSLLSSAAFTRSLNDVNNEQSWDALRQLPSAHSHMTLLSRQNNNFSVQTPVRSRAGGGLRNTFPGASLSMGNLNVPNAGPPNQGGFPVSNSKWKLSDVPHHQPEPVCHDTLVLPDSSSPDSSYSSESTSEMSTRSPQMAHFPPPVPVPKVQLHKQNSNASLNQQKRSKYLKDNSKRKSDKGAVSPTPQLDKILWALVPDEFANISDTGVSDMEPMSSQYEPTSSRYVTFTDLETGDGGQTSRVPDTPRRPMLTKEVLSKLDDGISNDDRIMSWLAECDQQSTTTNLPTHLPDISYTFKFAQGNL